MDIASRAFGRDHGLAQEDGDLPAVLSGGSAPGESGVSVLRLRFQGGMHFRATPRQHLVWFHLSSQVPFACNIRGRTLQHEPLAGTLAICPAGADGAADAEESVDCMLVAIDPARFALAAAEDEALDARLDERLADRDRILLEQARVLVAESTENFLEGPLFWNDVASGFVGRLVNRHASPSRPRRRGRLSARTLARVREHVMAHLDQPVDVDALAGIACLSPFHFSRMFARSVGMTPHRYVVRLRLQRAVELARQGRYELAEIAARTGFADQSHLSRWVRRVHGVPLSRLAA
jgi:AraC family transcriptional regulator